MPDKLIPSQSPEIQRGVIFQNIATLFIPVIDRTTQDGEDGYWQVAKEAAFAAANVLESRFADGTIKRIAQ